MHETSEVTAVSASGETKPSVALPGKIVDGGTLINWQAYTGIQSGTGTNFITGSSDTTDYNIYKSISGGPFGYIDTVPAPTQNTAAPISFLDQVDTPNISKKPLLNSYGFDPLSTNFTQAIANFFDYYPPTGISINGLVCGMPFDDQGSFSTSIEYAAAINPQTVTFDLEPWNSDAAVATTTQLTVAPNPATVGQPVTLTATVPSATGSNIPGGLLNFVFGAGTQARPPQDLSAQSHRHTA
jgi:hypothetical protein